jgi:hypothetical protein
MGDSLDPDEITLLMGQQPHRAFRKGQPRTRPNGKAMPPARIGTWMLKTELGADETLDEGIERFLKSLPADESMWINLERRFQIELICDVRVRGANQGFWISPHVLKLLSDRQIELGVDIFPYPDEEQDVGLRDVFGRNKS